MTTQYLPKYEEATKGVKWAHCSCGFDAKLSRFRLTKLVHAGTELEKRVFDGTHRCPLCGRPDPIQRVEQIKFMREVGGS